MPSGICIGSIHLSNGAPLSRSVFISRHRRMKELCANSSAAQPAVEAPHVLDNTNVKGEEER